MTSKFVNSPAELKTTCTQALRVSFLIQGLRQMMAQDAFL